MTACYGDLHVKIQWCQGNKGNKEEESNPRYVTKEESTREGESKVTPTFPAQRGMLMMKADGGRCH